jgi:hypothetical protein
MPRTTSLSPNPLFSPPPPHRPSPLVRGGVALALGAFLAALASCDAPARAPAAKTAGEMPVYAPCNVLRNCKDCPNDEYHETNCLTTAYGPARANVITVKQGTSAQNATNMLRCDGGDYAMCFFSGPPGATGHQGNPELPCVLNEKGDTANCTCRAYSTGPYYVDIHAINNLRVYYQTIDACGHEGELCYNLSNCPAGSASCTTPGFRTAPVCEYIKNQNPKDPKVSLVPGAELISTFSFAMQSGYPLGSVSCPPDNAPPDTDFLYAGCMTAPCTFPQGRPSGTLNGQPVQCSCPTWRGPYQVGQSGQSCVIPASGGKRYVWSASYTVAPEPCKR